MGKQPPPGGPPQATIRDVARDAGVSIASASRALNGLNSVTPATRERVLAAARRLNYVPHVAARALSTQRTDTIGVMLPDLHGEFFSEIIRGADQAARARGLHLLVSTSHGDAPAAIAAMRAMRGRVDGLVMMSPHVDLAILADNLVGGFPTVLINTPVPGAPHPAFCIDNYAGARLAVEHLAMAVGSAGGSVAHIAGPATNHEARDRRRGFHDALAHLGGLEGPVLPGDFTESSGYAAGMALADMPKRPAAVFAANDEMAIGCMLALEARGLAVPSDILLVGFDDIPLSRLLRPALTTVRVNIADLSRRAMERLVQTMTDKVMAEATVETLKPSLVVRESSTPPLQA